MTASHILLQVTCFNAPNQIFKISGQIEQISGHLVNFRTFQDTF